MDYDTVIVRYGEIFLKSDYVRKSFEDVLVRNMRRRLESDKVAYRIYQRRHRIYVETGSAEAACESLKTVFGIVSLSPATKTGSGLPELTESAVALARTAIKPGESFAVRAQRVGSHPFSSKDVEEAAGARILEELDAVVDLEEPEKTVYVEIRDDEAYVYDKKVEGVGGMPYGTQGGLVSLLSTGIDSPVAAWMMMRRGCKVSFLHFGSLEEVEPIVKRLEYFCNQELMVWCIPHEPVLEAIGAEAGKYTCVVCKRFMHRAAELLAEKIHASGIVSGENVGQVASQTLENLEVIDCLRMPVYRPLVAMDKEEIIAVAKRIGTYELAVKGTKCPYVPDKPSTRAKLEEVLAAEEKIGIEKLLKDAWDSLVFGER